MKCPPILNLGALDLHTELLRRIYHQSNDDTLSVVDKLGVYLFYECKGIHSK